MKTLELNEMESLQGFGGGSGTAFVCAFTVLASAAVLVGTAGAGAPIAAYASGAACGGSIGWGLASGSWW